MQAKEELIKQLTEELKPVKTLWSPPLRFVLWSGLSVILIVGIMLVIQPFRANFYEQLSSKKFFLETLFSILPFISLGFLCLRLAIPGLRVSRLFFLLALSPFFLFLLSIGYGHFGGPSLPPTMAGKRPYCFYEVLVLSWIPILVMVQLIRRAHAFVNIRLAFMVGLAGSALPMALMQVACMYDPAHILSHHIFGAVIVTSIMSGLGLFLLKKKS